MGGTLVFPAFRGDVGAFVPEQLLEHRRDALRRRKCLAAARAESLKDPFARSDCGLVAALTGLARHGDDLQDGHQVILELVGLRGTQCVGKPRDIRQVTAYAVVGIHPVKIKIQRGDLVIACVCLFPELLVVIVGETFDHERIGPTFQIGWQ